MWWVMRLSDQEFVQMLVKAGYSEQIARTIVEWYNSH